MQGSPASAPHLGHFFPMLKGRLIAFHRVPLAILLPTMDQRQVGWGGHTFPDRMGRRAMAYSNPWLAVDKECQTPRDKLGKCRTAPTALDHVAPYSSMSS